VPAAAGGLGVPVGCVKAPYSLGLVKEVVVAISGMLASCELRDSAALSFTSGLLS
jgi:hypothetical protein